MKPLLRLLATNKRYWVPPILIYLGLVYWLATKGAEAPTNPFEYRMD